MRHTYTHRIHRIDSSIELFFTSSKILTCVVCVSWSHCYSVGEFRQLCKCLFICNANGDGAAHLVSFHLSSSHTFVNAKSPLYVNFNKNLMFCAKLNNRFSFGFNQNFVRSVWSTHTHIIAHYVIPIVMIACDACYIYRWNHRGNWYIEGAHWTQPTPHHITSLQCVVGVGMKIIHKKID